MPLNSLDPRCEGQPTLSGTVIERQGCCCCHSNPGRASSHVGLPPPRRTIFRLCCEFHFQQLLHPLVPSHIVTSPRSAVHTPAVLHELPALRTRSRVPLSAAAANQRCRCGSSSSLRLGADTASGWRPPGTSWAMLSSSLTRRVLAWHAPAGGCLQLGVSGQRASTAARIARSLFLQTSWAAAPARGAAPGVLHCLVVLFALSQQGKTDATPPRCRCAPRLLRAPPPC